MSLTVGDLRRALAWSEAPDDATLVAYFDAEGLNVQAEWRDPDINNPTLFTAPIRPSAAAGCEPPWWLPVVAAAAPQSPPKAEQ